jgi:Flp pilus assembly protein TadG
MSRANSSISTWYNKVRRNLHSDNAGLAAVEFALLAPVMILLICGSLEMGHMIFARIALDGAVVEAARAATASLETEESTRTQLMRNSIRRTMENFNTAPGQSISIETTVYRDFSTAYPENFTDTNGNRVYNIGEPFTDRNANGKWDPATPITGTLGGAGDVVSYTATFPKAILFSDFLPSFLNFGRQFTLKSTTVMRNEAVVRR